MQINQKMLKISKEFLAKLNSKTKLIYQVVFFDMVYNHAISIHDKFDFFMLLEIFSI